MVVSLRYTYQDSEFQNVARTIRTDSSYVPYSSFFQYVYFSLSGAYHIEFDIASGSLGNMTLWFTSEEKKLIFIMKYL